MEKEDIIYHPHRTFETQLKNQYHQAAEDYFNELVEKTETDAAANKAHVADYRAALAELELAKKKWGKTKAIRTFFIVMTIICFLAGILGFVLFGMNTESYGFLIMGIVGIVLGIAQIFAIVHFHKKAKNQASVLAPLEQKVSEKLAICEQDMARLNAEFDWNMASVIMENTTPMIDLDPYFSNETLGYLMSRFRFPEQENDDTSVLGILSGHIQGNPFVLEKVLCKTMGMKTYTGSITITWTEYVGSGKDRRMVTRSQVLTATVEKECPYYSTDTRLIFGCEAAPNLSFSRGPSGADKMSAKEREKAWKAGGKKLDKMVVKATKKGEDFSKMNNDEFEVFWGANNRDNEVEFRYMFSPLAQQSILELIENPEPFGDDFYFTKDKMLSSVASAHSQNFNYNVAPSYFYDYCLEDCKKRFIEYSDNFIKGLYFDLAPFLAIPSYQITRTRDYIYDGCISGNYNSYEHEVCANGFDSSLFRPRDSSLSVPVILKTGKPSKRGETDVVPVRAYSFRTEPRVDYVSRYGGDGRYHSVPVHWEEYIPVDSKGEMSVRNVGGSQKKYRGALGVLDEYLTKTGVKRYFERGFVAFGSNDKTSSYNQGLDDKLTSIFKDKE